MFKNLSTITCSVLLFLVTSKALFGVDQKQKRIALDWTQQKISFYGEAEPKGDQNFKLTEQSARQEMQIWLQNDARAELKELVGRDFTDVVVANLKASMSSKTVYAADGKVRVYFEMPTSSLWDENQEMVGSQIPSTWRDRTKAGPPKSTGLIVKVKGAKKPLFTYRVVDEKGHLLFDATQVEADSFRRRQLGRWVNSKSLASIDAKELSGAEQVDASVSDDGKSIVVDRKQWESAVSGNENFLMEAKHLMVFSN